MFTRFTDRARKAMALANEEAARIGDDYIGTEHLLLGLVKEGTGVGACVLKLLDVDYPKVSRAVEKLADGRGGAIAMDKLIEHANRESEELGSGYVGTEHLLLALLNEPEAPAAQVLQNLGLRRERVREAVAEVLGGNVEAEGAAPPCETADAKLAEVVEAWPDLSASVRQSILALVRRRGSGEGN
jgi:ATP-dependent Clp protease ATP-binding subunit ClpC